MARIRLRPCAVLWCTLALAALGVGRVAQALEAGDAADPAVDADVVVVGLGPVGNFLCHLLSGYGVRKVIAFEREAREYQAPRAVGWDDYTLRAADATSAELRTYMRWHAIILANTSKIEGCAGLRSGRADNRWNAGCIDSELAKWDMDHLMVTSQDPLVAFHQPAWERQMRRLLTGLPGVSVFYETDVVEVAIVGGLCEVSVQPFGKAGGDRRVVRARYCVAADGGSSGVRRQLGVTFEGETFPDQPWIVVDTVVRDEAYLRESWLSREGLGFVMNTECPFVFVPTPAFMDEWWANATSAAAGAKSEAERLRLRDEEMHRLWELYRNQAKHVYPPGTGFRFEMLLEPGTSPEEAVTDAFVADKLRTCAEVDPTRVEIVRKVVYTFHARRAGKWRVGPVLIMGDAAHCMPPFQGQGMNSGIRDAANLAWKLALVLQGLASDRLLDSYEPERRANLQQVTQGSKNLGGIVMVRNPVLAFIRNAFLSFMKGIMIRFPSQRGKTLFARAPDIVSPRSVLGSQEGETAPGLLFPSPEVLVPGSPPKRLLLDDLIAKNGFTLIFSGSGPEVLAQDFAVDDEDLRFLQQLGAAAVAVAPHGAPLGAESTPPVPGLLGGRCADAIGRWTVWASDHRLDGRVTLVRPDRYIYGAFENVSVAVARLRASLWATDSPRDEADSRGAEL